MDAMAEKKERKLHYDLLRIVAAFSVVVLHSSAQFWYYLDLHSAEWLIVNGYDAVFRFGVPIFVMLSGAMFLAPDYQLDVKRLFRHNILRMLVLYGIWSFLYALYSCRNLEVLNLKTLLRAIITGYYHLWFIPMIIGIYLLLPILKGWVEKAEKCQVQYFLGLFFVLQILRITMRTLVVSDEIHTILDTWEIEMACGYLGYFVWGYYLAHVGIGDKMRKILYVMFVPAVILNIVVSTLLSRRAGEAEGVFFDSYGICTFVMVSAMFVFTVDRGSRMSFGKKSAKWIKELSANTLGVYLLHLGMLEVWRAAGFHSMTLPVAVGIPVLSILCFAVCTAIAGLLRRIPIVGRFLC